MAGCDSGAAHTRKTNDALWEHLVRYLAVSSLGPTGIETLPLVLETGEGTTVQHTCDLKDASLWPMCLAMTALANGTVVDVKASLDSRQRGRFFGSKALKSVRAGPGFQAKLVTLLRGACKDGSIMCCSMCLGVEPAGTWCVVGGCVRVERDLRCC